MSSLHITELLCFLTVNFDNLHRENLLSTLHDFYGFREASEAKSVIIAECKKIPINDSIQEFTIKRVEGKSGALRRVISDVVDIWTVIDREKKGELSVQFVAVDPNRLPGVNVEKINAQFLTASIIKLQEQV